MKQNLGRVPRDLFTEVLKKGKPYSTPFLRLRFQPTNILKVSFVVSQKVARKAHERNLLKRRGYAILRKIKTKIKPGIYLFFIQPSANKLPFKDLEETILSLLKKSNSYNE